MKIWAIVPVKSLQDSKSRLSHVLTGAERAELTGRLLKRTLAVLEKTEAIKRSMVVSRDPVALKIARQLGASTFVETSRQELNTALTGAAHVAERQGARCVLILPADLPFVEVNDLSLMVEALPAGLDKPDRGAEFVHGAMVICGDQSGTGTNALLVYPPTALSFRFGANSYNVHLNQAAALSMARTSVKAPGIAFDLDTEDDWRAYQELSRTPSEAG